MDPGIRRRRRRATERGRRRYARRRRRAPGQARVDKEADRDGNGAKTDGTE